MSISLKNRPCRFYLQTGAGVAAVISGIALWIIDASFIKSAVTFRDMSFLSSLFMIIGGLVSLAAAFTKFDFLSIVSSALFGCGLGQHLYLACFPYADVLTGVPFFVADGTNGKIIANICTVFLVIFGLCLASEVVSSFLGAKKPDLQKPGIQAQSI
jgi:hypothetical protein